MSLIIMACGPGVKCVLGMAFPRGAITASTSGVLRAESLSQIEWRAPSATVLHHHDQTANQRDYRDIHQSGMIWADKDYNVFSSLSVVTFSFFLLTFSAFG